MAQYQPQPQHTQSARKFMQYEFFLVNSLNTPGYKEYAPWWLTYIHFYFVEFWSPWRRYTRIVYKSSGRLCYVNYLLINSLFIFLQTDREPRRGIIDDKSTFISVESSSI